ncbi:MAG: hypothetical protein WBC22_02835 [Sedimentisphaerales bacterium]
MKTEKYWILVIVVLAKFSLCSDKCLAIESGRFHSEANGYSVAIPDGWRQVPENVIRQAFEASMSENKLTFDIETILAIEFEENSLKYPYAVIQVTRYSKYGVNKPLKKEEIKKFFKMTTETLRLETPKVEYVDEKLSASLRGMVSPIEWGKLYLDNENMSYLLGADMEVANLGRLKSLLLENYGRYAFVKIRFVCLDSDWQRFKNERELILSSFKFDPTTDYKGAQTKSKSFWEDKLVDVGIYGTIALVIGLIGIVGGIIERKWKAKAKDEQNE